jgi:YcxB-like protein
MVAHLPGVWGHWLRRGIACHLDTRSLGEGTLGDEIGGDSDVTHVSIEFELSREELEPFWRWQVTQAYRMKRGIIFTFPLLVAGVILLADTSLPSTARILGIVMLGVGLMQLVLFAYIYLRVPARAWKQRPAGTGITKIEVSDQDVRVHTKNSDVVNRWDVYSDTIERDGLYLLRLGKRRAYTIVPKRAFQSDDAASVFRGLVERHTQTEWSGRPHS